MWYTVVAAVKLVTICYIISTLNKCKGLFLDFMFHLLFLGICLHCLLEKGKWFNNSIFYSCLQLWLKKKHLTVVLPCQWFYNFSLTSCMSAQYTIIDVKAVTFMKFSLFLPLLWFPRLSARFPQHRRKKRKEMDEGIPESNQHKQSKLSANIENNSATN